MASQGLRNTLNSYKVDLKFDIARLPYIPVYHGRLVNNCNLTLWVCVGSNGMSVKKKI